MLIAMSRFQLPCENCGHIQEVTATLAGSEIVCSQCQQHNRVPTLRLLRELAPISTPVPEKPGRHWGATNGLVFSIGFAAIALGLIGGGYCGYQVYQANSEIRQALGGQEDIDFSNLDHFAQTTTQMNEAHLWNSWKEALKVNLGEWRPTVLRALKDRRDEYFQYFVGYGVILCAGCLLCLVSFFLPASR